MADLDPVFDNSMIFQTKAGPLEVSGEIIRSIKRIWPTKDVDRELAAMQLWLIRKKRQRPVHFWRFLDNWMLKSPNSIQPAPRVSWWKNIDSAVEVGRNVGVEPRPGEDLPSFCNRISERLAERIQH